MGAVDEVMSSALSGAEDELQRRVVRRMCTSIPPILLGSYNTEMRLPGGTRHATLLGLSAAHATTMSALAYHCAGDDHGELGRLVDAIARMDERMLRAFVRNGVGAPT